MIFSGDRIGPTAHYTGYVWARNGLSHPELETREGRVLFDSLQPAMLVSRAAGGATLESYLLARHRAIDALLERAIERGEVTQVIEVACGLSPRGWRFARGFGNRLTYVEADLPEMAERKRAALERIGSLSDHHRVREVDALRDDDGPGSLAAIAAELDAGEGLAIITEACSGTSRRTRWRACGGGSRARSTVRGRPLHLRPASGGRADPAGSRVPGAAGRVRARARVPALLRRAGGGASAASRPGSATLACALRSR